MAIGQRALRHRDNDAESEILQGLPRRLRVAGGAGSPASRRPSLRTLGLPMIDRSGGLAGERKLDAPALRGRGIQCMDGLDHGAAIVAVLARRSPPADAVDEVLHLLGEAVVPDFLVDRERPAGGGT